MVGIQKVIICLAGKTHDDIRSDARMGKRFPDPLNALLIKSPLIASAHSLKDAVTAGLQGYMKMWYKFIGTPYKIYDLLRE